MATLEELQSFLGILSMGYQCVSVSNTALTCMTESGGMSHLVSHNL